MKSVLLTSLVFMTLFVFFNFGCAKNSGSEMTNEEWYQLCVDSSSAICQKFKDCNLYTTMLPEDCAGYGDIFFCDAVDPANENGGSMPECAKDFTDQEVMACISALEATDCSEFQAGLEIVAQNTPECEAYAACVL